VTVSYTSNDEPPSFVERSSAPSRPSTSPPTCCEANVDFADARTIMTGVGLMGTGIAKGEHSALEAA